MKACLGAILWLLVPAWLLFCFFIASFKAGIRNSIALMNDETASALLTFDFLNANRWLLLYVAFAFAVIGGALAWFQVKTQTRIPFFVMLAAPVAILAMQLTYLGLKIIEIR